jgi:hypothetical protein
MLVIASIPPTSLPYEPVGGIPNTLTPNPKTMKTQTPNPQTLSPADLLCEFVDGRPGIDPVNYGSWKDYRRESAEVTRDRRDFYELFIFALRKVQDLDAKIERHLKTSNGRLTMDEAGKLRYITGQYFPTEYRPAACRVLVSILWNDTRETMPHLETGHQIRAYLRRQFSRRLNSNYFN